MAVWEDIVDLVGVGGERVEIKTSVGLSGGKEKKFGEECEQ